MTISRFGSSAACGLALLFPAGCTTGPGGPAATSYDLRIDTAFNTMPVSSRHLLIVITPAPGTTPAPAGSAIIVQGSMTMSTGASFTPWSVVGTGWTCTGNWAAFQCAKTLTAPLNNEIVQLFTSYATQPPNATVTYVAGVTMAGNNDPDPTNNNRTVTHGL